MLRGLREKASPAMIVAVAAFVFATTGSAFAARTLITGSDIKDGSITKADLAPSAQAAKAQRGPRGPRGPRGFQGEQGPQGDQGLIGPQGERGATGAVGPTGPVGPVGSTGAKGDIGVTGAQGPQGDPGQSLAGEQVTSGGPIDVGASVSSTGPAAGEGVDLSNGGIFMSPGQYRVDAMVSFNDPAGDDSGLEYGVGRLFLDGSPLDGVTADPFGGSAPLDTAIVTPDVPDNGTNVAQASGAFIIQVADDGSGGETLTLVGAVRSAEAEGASASGHVIVSRIS